MASRARTLGLFPDPRFDPVIIVTVVSAPGRVSPRRFRTSTSSPVLLTVVVTVVGVSAQAHHVNDKQYNGLRDHQASGDVAEASQPRKRIGTGKLNRL
jgi:hypothetical protein